MNKQDINHLRLAAEVQVQNCVLHALIAAVATFQRTPGFGQALEASLTNGASALTFPRLDPASSDMVAGEFQEAAAAFLKTMNSYLSKM
jgi:hypothetical protein